VTANLRTRVLLALGLVLAGTLAACTGDEALPEPAEVESCDGLVDAGTELVEAYADLLEDVRVEDLADGEPIPELDELERVGDELDASVARLGCDPADLNRRIAAAVEDLATDSPAAAVLLEVVRSGVVTEPTTGGEPGPTTTTG
jgi:hypothetical protein